MLPGVRDRRATRMETDAPRMIDATGAFRDSSQQQRDEAELRDSEQFLSSALDALSAHIAILDERGVIVAVNEAWRSFGDDNRLISPASDIGVSYLDVCDTATGDDADDAHATAAGIRAVMDGDIDRFYLEYPCDSPTVERWFGVRVTRFSEDGPPRVVVAHEDLTQRRRAEQQQTDFLAMVTHDLRGPLGVIRGFAELMLRRNAFDERGLGLIVSQTRHMERMVADLLDAAAIEAGRLELNRMAADLGTIVRANVEQARTLSDRHEVDVEADAGAFPVEVDVTRIDQVLQNLLGNAIKYSPRGGPVRVRVWREGDRARVAVTDSGIGIPEAALDRLFDRYYRVGSGGGAPGLGLGLAIARSLVEAHGGSIDVRSTVDEGSTFTVTLPLAAA